MRILVLLALFLHLTAFGFLTATIESAKRLLVQQRYGEAVTLLEQHLGKIDGNREYLNTLKEAYQGHLRALLREKKEEEAQRVFGRLRILDYEAKIEDYRPRPTTGGGPVPWVMEVSHASAGASGWATATSNNFKIWHRTTMRDADDIAHALEKTRRVMLKKWFGDDEWRWNKPCEVHVYPDTASYVATTSLSADTPSYFKQTGVGEAITSRLIVVNGAARNLLGSVLPHEATHAVLSGRFGAEDAPRWVDEGMSILSESIEDIDTHLRSIPGSEREGRLYPIRELMQLKFYLSPLRQKEFYAQSASLVDLLANRHGTKVFIQFVKDGLRSGWPTALKTHYRVDGYEQLEERWKARVLFPGIIE